jgi:uncharacterized protein DUF5658
MSSDVATLPGSRTRALWILALFAAIQVADGALTAAGVAQFGPRIEGNPLIALAFQGAGIGMALVTAKLFAMSCAMVLYVYSRHLALALMTLAYVVGAIVPWMFVLASAS